MIFNVTFLVSDHFFYFLLTLVLATFFLGVDLEIFFGVRLGVDLADFVFFVKTFLDDGSGL